MALTSTPVIPDWDSLVTPPSPAETTEVPIAVWICVALAGYGIVLGMILIIRQCVTSKGMCGECRFNCCEGSCTQWCVEACQASCDCKSPTLYGCLDAICPQRRNINIADAVMCRCCADQCGCCDDGCQCGDCNCNCNCDCDNINCLCCELNMNPQRPPPPPAGNY